MNFPSIALLGICCNRDKNKRSLKIIINIKLIHNICKEAGEFGGLILMLSIYFIATTTYTAVGWDGDRVAVGKSFLQRRHRHPRRHKRAGSLRHDMVGLPQKAGLLGMVTGESAIGANIVLL